MPPVYLDYNATTPLDPRVFEAMKPFFMDEFGNAGSRTHVYGQKAKDAVEKARQQVAYLLNAKSEEIIFTSGATESNNLALLGLRDHGESTGKKHILTTAIEHKSVLEPLEYLATKGFELEIVPVTPGGFVEVNEIKKRLRKDTLLVSVMHSNNETGVMQPVLEIGNLLESTETLFHVDGAQTFGKEVDETRNLICDFFSLSAHKIYGPKGIGALYAKRKSGKKRIIKPIMFGGGQEMGFRPGTLPVPLIVGLGTAAFISSKEYLSWKKQNFLIKKNFLESFKNVDFEINGDQEKTQSHVINLCIKHIENEALTIFLKEDFCFSNGSACTSNSYYESHVLKAMGYSVEKIHSSVRFSWSHNENKISAELLAEKIESLKITK